MLLSIIVLVVVLCCLSCCLSLFLLLLICSLFVHYPECHSVPLRSLPVTPESPELPSIWSSARRFSAEFPLPFVYLCYTFGIGLVSFYQGSHELRERVGRAEALGAFNSPASSVPSIAECECKDTLNIYPFANVFSIFFIFYPRLYPLT